MATAITRRYVLWLGVCAFSMPAMAQGTAGIAVTTTEAGFRYAYNSVLTSETAESNQSGASVYGEYFLGRTAPMWHGQSRLNLIGDFSGSGSGSARLYTFLGGIRLNTKWRKLQLDFPTMEVPDPVSGVSHWRGAVRLSGGIGYRFGRKP